MKGIINMQFKYPNKINEIIKDLDYKVDDIGRSNDYVITFEKKYVLKISKNIDLLKREYEINEYLNNKIPCTKNILFIIEEEYAYYLRTYLDGYSLIDTKYISNPELLIEALCKTVNVLNSLEKFEKCKYLAIDSIGDSFIHGDLCLPNIYFDEDNNFIGFIDLGSGGLGDPWYDYAWMLWSLEYNMKSDEYNKVLLDQIGNEFDEGKYNEYIIEEYRR